MAEEIITILDSDEEAEELRRMKKAWPSSRRSLALRPLEDPAEEPDPSPPVSPPAEENNQPPPIADPSPPVSPPAEEINQPPPVAEEIDRQPRPTARSKALRVRQADGSYDWSVAVQVDETMKRIYAHIDQTVERCFRKLKADLANQGEASTDQQHEPVCAKRIRPEDAMPPLGRSFDAPPTRRPSKQPRKKATLLGEEGNAVIPPREEAKAAKLAEAVPAATPAEAVKTVKLAEAQVAKVAKVAKVAADEASSIAPAEAAKTKSTKPAAVDTASVVLASVEAKSIESVKPASKAVEAEPVTPTPEAPELETPTAPEGERRLDLRRANWPPSVVHLRENFNPTGLTFSYRSHVGNCGCASPCRAPSCRNAQLGLFCTSGCCVYGGMCGNSLPAFQMVTIASRSDALGRTLVATTAIDKGVIIGEYLGEMKAIHPSAGERAANGGYVLMMSERAEQIPRERVAIDAKRMGSLMRFLNHSCAPVSCFSSLSNGRKHTVVVVTTKAIAEGQEVTVNYGRELWFTCRCGHASCTGQEEQEYKQEE